jgi:hypothetical protein
MTLRLRKLSADAAGSHKRGGPHHENPKQIRADHQKRRPKAATNPEGWSFGERLPDNQKLGEGP